MQLIQDDLGSDKFSMTSVLSFHYLPLLCDISYCIIESVRQICYSVNEVVSLRHNKLNGLSHAVFLRINI
jgi:hypothetical protein